MRLLHTQVVAQLVDLAASLVMEVKGLFGLVQCEAEAPATQDELEAGAITSPELGDADRRGAGTAGCGSS